MEQWRSIRNDEGEEVEAAVVVAVVEEDVEEEEDVVAAEEEAIRDDGDLILRKLLQHHNLSGNFTELRKWWSSTLQDAPLGMYTIQLDWIERWLEWLVACMIGVIFVQPTHFFLNEV